MPRGPAPVPLTPDGWDSEYAAIRPNVVPQLSQLWALPMKEFLEAWANTPATLPEGAPTLENSIDARHETVIVRDGTEIEVLIYRPKDAGSEMLPLFFFTHGGGWMLGTHTIDEGNLRYVCARNGCMVVSVEFRK